MGCKNVGGAVLGALAVQMSLRVLGCIVEMGGGPAHLPASYAQVPMLTHNILFYTLDTVYYILNTIYDILYTI